MIEGFRKGYIQFGITIGLLSSIVLAIWLWPLHHHDIVSDNNNTISLATKNKNPAKSNTTPNNTNHPNYYEHQDLKAQEAMAEATEAIVFWTKVSLTIGAISISGIFWTLYETRRQVAETRNQTNIMREEHRPWVDFEIITVAHLEENTPIRVLIDITNVGKSIAISGYAYFRLCDIATSDALKTKEIMINTLKNNNRNYGFSWLPSKQMRMSNFAFFDDKISLEFDWTNKNMIAFNLMILIGYKQLGSDNIHYTFKNFQIIKYGGFQFLEKEDNKESALFDRIEEDSYRTEYT